MLSLLDSTTRGADYDEMAFDMYLQLLCCLLLSGRTSCSLHCMYRLICYMYLLTFDLPKRLLSIPSLDNIPIRFDTGTGSLDLKMDRRLFSLHLSRLDTRP